MKKSIPADRDKAGKKGLRDSPASTGSRWDGEANADIKPLVPVACLPQEFRPCKPAQGPKTKLKIMKGSIIPVFKKWWLIAGLFLPFALAAQPTESSKETAFAGGERLVYAISYKVGIVHSDVAEVTFQTTLERFGTQKAYRIEANGKTYPFFNWFFNLDDTYISRLDAETLRPLDLQIEIREGGYRVSSGYHYDWPQKKVSTFFFNHKRADSSHHVMTLQEGSFDAVALFFNLRCENIDLFKEGENRTLHMVLSDTIRTIRYRFVGREKKNIKDLGKFNTLKFVCQLATSDGESFKDGSEFTLWISDDKNKIPLYIESPIRVGSIRGRLLHAEKLKYPLESMIR